MMRIHTRRAGASLATGTVAVLIGSLLWSMPATAAEEPPFAVVDGLIDTSDTQTLGLDTVDGVETFTIYEPGDDDRKFNHGTVLIEFKGELYAQWQRSALDEDAPDTIVRYATSADGQAWSEPSDLTVPRTDGYTSNGGWWTDGETLVAYLNVWPSDRTPKSGYAMYRTSTDGATWTEAQRLTGADGQPVEGIFEQDPKALPSGRILSAVHEAPGLYVKPYYTDDPTGTTGWTAGAFENQPGGTGMSRELEPSWYLRDDGSIVMVFRDQGGNTLRKLGAVSHDDGATWGPSVLTNVPDSRTKQSAGNLPDGTAYLVGNPTGTRIRYPLSILLSADGRTFDTAYNLRDAADLQPKRYDGLYKNPGYSYPKSYVWGEHLYAAYGTNKEDVEITRVPLEQISLRGGDDGATAAPAVGTLSHDNGWDTGLQDGAFTVNMNLWWGENGSVFRLYENGVLIATEPLAHAGVQAQSVAVAVDGRADGTYVYTGELLNSRGTTATTSVTVDVTDAAPGRPVVRDAGSAGDVVRLAADLWWGTNASSYRILEDGAVVAEGPLDARTPAAQSVTVELTERAAGARSYVVEFVNAAGATASAPLTIALD